MYSVGPNYISLRKARFQHSPLSWNRPSKLKDSREKKISVHAMQLIRDTEPTQLEY
jgi:hypothetical protein